ncbi:ribulose-phosphate 3-epimerase [Alistipes putredinis]|uniref:ribulose-phosphate 3-epimerase n=1 Tax=Alistipes putredinis TaxID=28117 RepID=UPI0039922B19
MNRIVAPSMLSADFGHLERDTQMIDRSAAEWVHIDVMDGVFVPNISFGFPVLKAIRKATAKCLDVHLMIVEPERYVARFAEAGADVVTFHYEATYNPKGCIEMIRNAGAKVGVSIKPATSVEVLRDILPQIDLVLIMSVEPGFGGQAFIPASLERSRSCAHWPTSWDGDDHRGGRRHFVAQRARGFGAGADVLVAGNAVFGAEDPEAEIVKISTPDVPSGLFVE